VDNFTAVDGDYLLPLLVLRQRLTKTMGDASLVREIPGAKLVRTPRGRSIAEVEVRLEEIARFRVEPLIAAAIANRLFGSNPAAREIVRAQLSFDQRLLLYMQGREAAFRDTLITYQSQQGSREAPPTPGPGAPAAQRPAGDTLMPQLSDTFLNRLVDLANNTVDREYRQKLSDQIKEASLDVVPAQMAVQYDNELLASFSSAPGASGVAAASLQPQLRAAVAELKDALVDLNAIYAQASRQLYPETELYRVTAPPMVRVDRATSPARLALFGFLTLPISFPVIVIAALLHNRVREEEAVDQQPEQG
jgi:hypothetical protein